MQMAQCECWHHIHFVSIYATHYYCYYYYMMIVSTFVGYFMKSLIEEHKPSGVAWHVVSTNPINKWIYEDRLM